MSESPGSTGSTWSFSVVGLVWLVIAGALFFTMDTFGILVGLGALAYSIYLFRGGRVKFIIW